MTKKTLNPKDGISADAVREVDKLVTTATMSNGDVALTLAMGIASFEDAALYGRRLLAEIQDKKSEAGK